MPPLPNDPQVQRIAGLLRAELARSQADPERAMSWAVAELILRDEIAIPSLPTTTSPPATEETLTPRGCAAASAACLDTARTIGTRGLPEAAPLGHVLIAAAEAYRTLGVTIAGNVAMQPEQKEDN